MYLSKVLQAIFIKNFSIFPQASIFKQFKQKPPLCLHSRIFLKDVSSLHQIAPLRKIPCLSRVQTKREFYLYFVALYLVGMHTIMQFYTILLGCAFRKDSTVKSCFIKFITKKLQTRNPYILSTS